MATGSWGTALPWTSVTVAVAMVLSAGLAVVVSVDLPRLRVRFAAGPGVTVRVAAGEVTVPSTAVRCSTSATVEALTVAV